MTPPRDTATTPASRRSFGSIRKLPSGRFQARYRGPDRVVYTAPITFGNQRQADTYLSTIRADIVRDTWAAPTPPTELIPTLAEYAAGWVADRQLKPRTRSHYQKLLDAHVLPALGAHRIDKITPAAVRTWHSRLKTGPTAKAHAYSLLKSILGTAVTDDLVVANPCRIRGGGQSKRQVKIKPASLAELTVLVEAMPPRYRAMVLLAAWCGLRFGELTALTRDDVDTKSGIVHVRRGVVRVDGEVVVGTPKSEAGLREVRIPPHLVPVVRAHVLEHAAPGREGLLFPARGGGHLNPSALSRVYYPAREAAGRPDLRFHDLRHTGAVLAASTGASLAELMARLGHSTVGAAMRYQHASQDRDAEIAVALSALAHGDQVV